MNDLKSLDHLGPIADEMLGGLHADEAMRLRIRRAAADGHAAKRSSAARLVPALCCAALALVCVGAAGLRLSGQNDAPATLAKRSTPQTVSIETIAAGDGAGIENSVKVADLSAAAKVRAGEAASRHEPLFAYGEGDIPLLAVGGAVYRLLVTPQDIGGALLGGGIGSVSTYTDEPSLASADAMSAGLSNVAAEGAAIYRVNGLDEATAVAAEVDGRMRLFQRVSYAGRGPGGQGLEDTFGVRGQVKEVTLSGVGTLTGEKANEVIGVLLDQAVLKTADATARSQFLTVTLESGLKLQLGVSGDTLCGCGGWSCPEFFEAFEAAL